MQKLISMTDFVLEQGNPSNTDSQFADKVMTYANFLKQPLTLGMFVPCDDLGNVLVLGGSTCQHDFEVEQQAKERVLFKGWELVFNGRWGAEVAKNKITGMCQFNILNYKNIEYMFNSFDFDFILTASAIKQLNL